MKLLSVFNKAPKHQRFNYTPRFYDPLKEELEEREERIKSELARERGEKMEEPGDYRARISGAFQAARKRNDGGAKIDTNATLLRFGILLFLTLFIVAYLEWGKPALYSFFLLIPIYLYWKFKKR